MMREMRLWIALALVASVACSYSPSSTPPAGDDDDMPDAPMAYVLPEPMLIPGGGVHDSPIQAGLNVVVIDVETNAPIPGATVTIGAFTGTTDAAGVVTLDDATVVGKQTVLATATGYRAEQWVGVNGANVTIPLSPPLPPFGNAVGQITNFGSLPIAGGSNHTRRGSIDYSQEEIATSAANNLDTPGFTDSCAGAVCNFTIRSRTGTVSLMAAIVDRDDKFTADRRDDTETILGYAYRQNVTIANGSDTAGQDLTIITGTDLTTATVDYGTLPTGSLGGGFSSFGIETGPGQWVPLPGFGTIAQTVPKLTAVAGATSYRLNAFASPDFDHTFSIAVRRGTTNTALSVGTWLGYLQNVTATPTGAGFDALSGATYYSVTWQDDPTNTDLLEIVVFDGTTTLTVPASVAVPTDVDITVQAFASGIDVTNFGFDADATTLTDFSVLIVGD
jgi:hypothetical protein